MESHSKEVTMKGEYSEGLYDLNGLEDLKADPTERLYFIERTGVVIRWLLIITGSTIQLISPVIPSIYFIIVLPIAVVYNLGVLFLVLKKKGSIYLISGCTGVIDILVSLALIFFAKGNDVYLFYFVLLVSHAMRYGFLGSILSPVLFSIVYVLGLWLRGIDLGFQDLALRAIFFIITGIVSGYLAREERRRFEKTLKQQRDLLITRQKRKEMRSMLQKYLSFNLVEELLKDPAKIQLGGSRQKVTVLFSDISGFTRLLSSVDAERVVAILNEYLTEMTNVIFTNGGMVDKFVGDAVIGIFGAPMASEGDAERAVRTAVEMQERLRTLQNGWKRSFKDVIEARIAVNTGEVILGNIGSPQRMDYTAIGEAVNIASRLQSIAELGTVAVSKSTYDEVKECVKAKRIGKVSLRGIPGPIMVYEVRSLCD
jgi:class 3 adenylate cyclase